MTHWPSKIRTHPKLQAATEQRAISLINNYLSNDKEVPATTARRLASLHEPLLKSGDLSQPHYLWTIICSAIDHLGADRVTVERLVALVECIAALPDIIDESTGKPIESDVKGQVFWHDLPGFLDTFRSELMSAYHTPPADLIEERRVATTWDDEIRRFTNANLFAALLLHDGPSRRERAACLDYALWHLSRALEVGITTSLGIKRTELFVPAAANWILVAGHDVYQACYENGMGDGGPAEDCWLDDTAVDGFLFTGNEGCNLERWGFWRARFDDVAQLDGVKPRVQQIAARAASEMIKITSEAMMKELGLST
ncbi:hypothetical protein C8Q74DRAFT_294846 [Fomes fomentarius]|nr:hypothetical protein C8Q74DRAFT_294846 [Fomes fomentarius]